MKKKSKSRKKRKSLKPAKREGNKHKAVSKRPERSGESLSLRFSQYAIVYDPITDQYSDLVPPEIEKEINELYFLVSENPQKAITRLNELRIQHPEHPRICNYLAKAYLRVKDSEKMIEVIEENYRRNPDYLFAKINYGEICLHRGDVQKIPIIFDHKFDLKTLYPERDEFHVTEAVSFFGLLGIYFLKINDIEQAKRMLKMLEDIDPDAEMTRVLKRRIRGIKRLNAVKGWFKIR